jgi:hypothetical protein
LNPMRKILIALLALALMGVIAPVAADKAADDAAYAERLRGWILQKNSSLDTQCNTAARRVWI